MRIAFDSKLIEVSTSSEIKDTVKDTLNEENPGIRRADCERWMLGAVVDPPLTLIVTKTDPLPVFVR